MRGRHSTQKTVKTSVRMLNSRGGAGFSRGKSALPTWQALAFRRGILRCLGGSTQHLMSGLTSSLAIHALTSLTTQVHSRSTPQFPLLPMEITHSQGNSIHGCIFVGCCQTFRNSHAYHPSLTIQTTHSLKDKATHFYFWCNPFWCSGPFRVHSSLWALKMSKDSFGNWET